MAEAAIEQERVGGVDPLSAETSIFISFTDFREKPHFERENQPIFSAIIF